MTILTRKELMKKIWSNLSLVSLRTFREDYHRRMNEADEQFKHYQYMRDSIDEIISERLKDLPTNEKYPKNSDNIITGPMK